MNRYRSILQDIKETSELVFFLTNMLEDNLTEPEYNLITKELNQLKSNIKELNKELGQEF